MAAILLCTVILATAAVLARAWHARAANNGGCGPYVNGTVIPVPCSDGSASDRSTGGSGASTTSDTCTTTPLSTAQAENLGLPPPSPGEAWALLDCLGGAVGPGPNPVLVSTATGAPQVTAKQLMLQALGELQIPWLRPATAPPRGSDGLVGLPEWFWIPAAGWHPRQVTVRAGTVWATVAATPGALTFEPGAGISPVTCRGPGTAYDPGRPAAAQHTACSYTYPQPSAGLPGNAYRASLTVFWRISWIGSGGAGGVLAEALPVSVALSIPVAQGEALVTSP
jgi:hypothetical protein